MHSHSVEAFTHDHHFLGERHHANERRAWMVVLVTAAMMVAEIAVGALSGSMALLADGWHMATHAAAIGGTALAYRIARRHVGNPNFSFGTGKLGELAGFSSALLLALVAVMIAYESALRLWTPVPIHFVEAIAVATVGLAVNLVSAWLLFDDHHHDHGHDHHHGHAEDHHGGRVHAHAHDTNLRAAYVHVLADALTSVMAIVALLAARYLGWMWLDPVIGLVGAVIILRWSWSLVVSAGAVLLDMVPDARLPDAIRRHLEEAGDRVTDLHLWRIGPGHLAAVVALVSDHPQAPGVYKKKLSDLTALSHVTIEVEACPHHAGVAAS